MTQGPVGVDPRDRSPLGLVRTARLIWRLLQDGRVPMLLKLIVPATLLYLLFPLDLLPDVLIGPGQLDDLGVILFGLWLFLELVPKGIVREYTGGQSGESAGADRGQSPVDVTYRVVDDEPPAAAGQHPALPPSELGAGDSKPAP